MDNISGELFLRLEWVLIRPDDLTVRVAKTPKEQDDDNPADDNLDDEDYSYVEPPAMLLDTIMCPETGRITFAFNEVWGRPGPVGAGAALLRVAADAWG